MTISVVIPTCNRATDLKETFGYILRQTVLPIELVIVDDSDNNETEYLVGNNIEKFANHRINLKYVRKEEKSASISRNVGVLNSTGDIILFLDDDIVLEDDYIEAILRVYQEKPEALGVQGYITNRRKSKIKNLIGRIFFLVHSENNKNRLLPSMQNVYADPLNKIINCEWMVGNNFSFTKKVLTRFKFDEKLKRISASEDDDLSYRIYKENPTGLYQTPYAKLVHKGSGYVRDQNPLSVALTQVYHWYLFFKNFNYNVKNKIIFLWSRLGLLLVASGVTILRLPESKALKPLYLISSYSYCFKHLKELKIGDLRFFDKALKKGKR